MPEDIGAHRLHLAAELLEDVELSRLDPAALILKAARLARLVEDDETYEWLQFEMYGYRSGDLADKYLTKTGRWTNAPERRGYFQGIAEIEGFISAREAQMSSLRLPDLSGDYVTIALRETRNDLAAATRERATFSAIRAKVVALVHTFVVRTYYELAFSEQQREMFDQARTEVDALLAPVAGDALSKVESIHRRLSEGDPEAISQALTTCRRLIDSVADVLYPPTDETVELGGNTLQLGASHHKNRLNAYVADREESNTRRAKLRRTLSDIYERVSSGVHSDVSATEARFLFLSTYLYLGEVLTLGDSED